MADPDPIPIPVGILRLPRAPDISGSRGFSSHSRPFQNLQNFQNNLQNFQNNSQDFQNNSQDLHNNSRAVQNSRAALRARFLRLLSSARGRPARFSLWNGIVLQAEFGAADVQTGAFQAEFGAADVQTGAFQVDSLQTPLGIQGSALLRSGDVLEFSFPLE